MISRRALILGSLMTCVPISATAEILHPARGTKLRKDLLDALRPIVEYQMGGPVEFVVERMNVSRDTAFLVVNPQRPGGKAISLDETLFHADANLMDGLTVFALAIRRRDRWSVIEHVTGPTDVAYAGWQEFYNLPDALIWSQ